MEFYGRPDISRDDNVELIITQDEIRNSIIKSGGTPIVILPTQDMIYYNSNEKELSEFDKEILNEQINLCDGIVMSGGYKIYYYDKYVCHVANEKHIPLFGICMGMQTMCCYNNENKNIRVEGHREKNGNCTHNVKILPNSKLFTVLSKEEILTNSFHSYAVPNSGSYTVSAVVGDVIEAVEKKEDLFNIGIQWHPEKYDNENSQNLFKEFIKACNTFHTKKLK